MVFAFRVDDDDLIALHRAPELDRQVLGGDLAVARRSPAAAGQLDPDRASIRQFHSDPAYGTANYANYSNPRVDELLLQGAATDPTSQESIDIYREVQQIVVDEAPMAFIYYVEEVALYHPWIEGWSIHPYSPNTFQNAHLITKNR